MVRNTFAELAEEVFGRKKEFPKYATQIINYANRYSQGTRPKVVGKVAELILECPHNDYKGWRRWYLKKYPKAIDLASKKTFEMVKNYRKVIRKIDRKMVRSWIEDLVIDKTYVGLKTQQAILKWVARKRRTTYRLANSREESKGIDGYIGKTPVSIKPTTYKRMEALAEDIPVRMIYYEKKKSYVNVDLSSFERESNSS